MDFPSVYVPAARRAARGRRSVVGVVLATLMLAVLVPAPVVAADATPVAVDSGPAVDPGPAGDFAWKGLNWEKRRWGGAPNYNSRFDQANVSDPDANGYVTLTLSNPTGDSTIGAEFNSTRRGFGYGTYSTTVEKDLSTLQKEVVWGCLFTYDGAAAPGFNEMDLCEASAWGGGSINNQVWPITQGHGYWFDASKGPGVGNDTTVFGVTDHPVLTHRMVWAPNKLTFETFAGEGYSGPLLKRTVMEGDKIPEPARESIHFNLWVTGGGGGDPAHVKPEKVVVRDFSFVPASSVVVPPIVAPAPSTPAPAPTKPALTKPALTKPALTKPALTKPAPTKPAPTKPAPTKTASSTSKSLPAIKLTSTSTKRGNFSTTLIWSRAKGAKVTLLSNGVKRTVKNTGRTTTTAKTASARYQICDATRCSRVVLGGR